MENSSTPDLNKMEPYKAVKQRFSLTRWSINGPTKVDGWFPYEADAKRECDALNAAYQAGLNAAPRDRRVREAGNAMHDELGLTIDASLDSGRRDHLRKFRDDWMDAALASLDQKGDDPLGPHLRLGVSAEAAALSTSAAPTIADAWISVKERLPEDELQTVRVRTSYEGWDQEFIAYPGTEDPDDVYWIMDMPMSSDVPEVSIPGVTHWKPITT